MPASQQTVLSQARDFVDALPASDRSPFILGQRLVAFFVENLDALIHTLGGIDAVIRTAEAAYDAYVAPLDIPGVPNLIEPQVDSAMRLAIGAVLRSVHSQVHRGG